MTARTSGPWTLREGRTIETPLCCGLLRGDGSGVSHPEGPTMRHDLQGMTQHKWDNLSRVERMMLADTSGLTQQLIGLEGWRVEVVDNDGTTRRFIVSRSTGWGPCHIEVSRRNAHGGPAARASYKSVRKLYQAWP